MSARTPPPEARTARYRETLRVLLFASLVAWGYVWCARQPDVALFSPSPAGYYGLQTAGFLRGQLAMALEPSRELLALPDPYDPVANAPYRAHDLTLHNGKYYLYFGVVPVLVFFLPVAAVTGYYPTEPLAVALFCAVGFVAGVVLVVRMRRRYFRAVTGWGLAMLLPAWALGSGAVSLLHGATFYQVPIACGFMLLMLGLVAVEGALHAATPWATTRRLLVAGACFGLCLGCRPNYILAPLVLLLPCWWLGGRQPQRVRWTAIYLAAVGAPVLLAGLAQLAYNQARFGSPLEFGLHMQLAGERMPQVVLLSPVHLWPNLQHYLFGAGTWSPYYPFLLATPAMPLGALRYFPMGWLILVASAPIWWRTRTSGAMLAGTVAGVALVNLLLLACFYWVTERYAVDYQPALMLAAGLGTLVVWNQTAGRPGGPWLRVLLAGLLLATSATGLAHILAQSPARARQWKPVEYWWNRSTQRWLPAAVRTPGIRRYRVRFARLPEGREEPLVESGTSAGRRDALTVVHAGGGRVQFKFFHAGLGGPMSEPRLIEPERTYLLEVHYGGLLPPPVHPAFDGWEEWEVALARNQLLVRLDGQTALAASLESYPSRPQDIRVGWTAYGGGDLASRFQGELTPSGVEPLRREDFRFPATPPQQAVRMRLRFPVDCPGLQQPLLATGATGNGDLLYVRYGAPGRVQFGIDHYGAGGPLFPEVTYLPEQEQEVLVWMGSWAAPEERTRRRSPGEAPAGQRLLVSFNGVTQMDFAHPFDPTTPSITTVGRNLHDSSAARALFTGRVLGIAGVRYADLPAPPEEERNGTVVLAVLLPRAMPGISQPLVTTGKTGAGDFLYFRFSDREHVVFGFDHWGVGGLTGTPVKIEEGRTYALEMTMGSLYSQEDLISGRLPRQLRNLVRIRMDGQVVLEGSSPCHPTEREEITIGRNAIGGSTTGEKFTGRILLLDRPATPAELVGSDAGTP